MRQARVRRSEKPTIQDRAQASYPWGALWFVGHDEEGVFDAELHQVVNGTRQMLGFLPTGRSPGSTTPLASLFWSMPRDAFASLVASPLSAWKQQVARLSSRAHILLDQIDSFEQVAFASYYDVRMSPWHHGRVVFVGDAAHATSPQLGQGANLALIDAWTLAQSLAEHHNVAAALSSYTQRRTHHVRYYQWASRWLTPFFQSSIRMLGPIRDLGFSIAHHIPPVRRQMIRTMAGLKQGLARRSLPYPQLSLPPASDST